MNYCGLPIDVVVSIWPTRVKFLGKTDDVITAKYRRNSYVIINTTITPEQADTICSLVVMAIDSVKA